jgi:hypothetical protein
VPAARKGTAAMPAAAVGWFVVPEAGLAAAVCDLTVGGPETVPWALGDMNNGQDRHCGSACSQNGHSSSACSCCGVVHGPRGRIGWGYGGSSISRFRVARTFGWWGSSVMGGASIISSLAPTMVVAVGFRRLECVEGTVGSITPPVVSVDAGVGMGAVWASV